MFQGNLITKEFIKKLIRSDLKLYYSSPEMNEHLYLHYKSNLFKLIFKFASKALRKLKIQKNSLI